MAEDLLRGVEERLRVKGREGEQIIRELTSHLQASQYELQLAGRTASDAAAESVRRFGDPDELAYMLTEVHRSRVPKVRLVAAVMLGLAGVSTWFGTSGTFAAPHTPTRTPTTYHGAVVKGTRHGKHHRPSMFTSTATPRPARDQR